MQSQCDPARPAGANHLRLIHILTGFHSIIAPAAPTPLHVKSFLIHGLLTCFPDLGCTSNRISSVVPFKACSPPSTTNFIASHQTKMASSPTWPRTACGTASCDYAMTRSRSTSCLLFPSQRDIFICVALEPRSSSQRGRGGTRLYK